MGARSGSRTNRRILSTPVSHLRGTGAQDYELETLNRHTVPTVNHVQKGIARPRRVALQTIMAAALVFVIATAGWKLYRMASLVGPSQYEESRLPRRRPKKEKPIAPARPLVPQLALDQESLEGYERELDAASKQLKEKWESASELVRDVLVNYYMPPVEDGPQDGNPLGLFLGYADAVRSDKHRDEATSESLRNDYVVRLRLVTSMLAAASRRIDAIAELEEFCTTREVAFPMFTLAIDVEKLTSPTDDLVTFEEFTRMLPDREIEFHDDNSMETEPPKIPRVIAQQLADTIMLQELQLQQDLAVHGEFKPFLEAVGEEMPPTGFAFRKLTMPGGKFTFPVDLFMTQLGGFKMMRSATSITSAAIGFWSMEWETERAIYRLEYLEDRDLERLSRGLELKRKYMEDAKRPRNLATLKNDIFPIVLYLL